MDFLTAMARCPRDDASFILSHLGRVTADAGAAARGDLGDEGRSGSGSGRAPDGSDIRPVPAMRRALTDAAGSPDAFLAMPAKARPPSPRIARPKPVRSCLARTNAAMDISLQALAGP